MIAEVLDQDESKFVEVKISLRVTAMIQRKLWKVRFLFDQDTRDEVNKFAKLVYTWKLKSEYFSSLSMRTQQSKSC